MVVSFRKSGPGSPFWDRGNSATDPTALCQESQALLRPADGREELPQEPCDIARADEDGCLVAPGGPALRFHDVMHFPRTAFLPGESGTRGSPASARGSDLTARAVARSACPLP